MWTCLSSKQRLKHDLKNMKNFEVLEDRGENGSITYHEKETEIPIMKKRELVSEMWSSKDAFGPGKHALWQHSTEHSSKPEQVGKYMPIRMKNYASFQCIEPLLADGTGTKVTEYFHVDFKGKQNKSEIWKVCSIMPHLYYTRYTEFDKLVR